MSNNFLEMLVYRITFILPAIIVALTVHELSHGYAAYLLGDNRAKNDGRLTLNPLKHIDPFGLILLLIAGFGWAKPVMVNPYNLKNPKQDMALISIAGPLSNFITAFIFLLIAFPFAKMINANNIVINYIFSLVGEIIRINIVLGIFNMLPIPPLDGSKVFGFILPDDVYFNFISFRYGFILLIVLLFTTNVWVYISPFIRFITNGFESVVRMIYFFL